MAVALALGVAVLALAIGIPSSSMAQQPKPAAPPKNVPTTAAAAPASTAEKSDYDLEIIDGQVFVKGGKMPATLDNVVEVLRERYRDVNIVMSPGLGSITVADLKLRASRVSEELEALRIATGDKFIVRAAGGSPPRIDPTTGIPVDHEVGLFVLEAVRGPQDEHQVEAFNVGPYLEWLREPSAQGAQKEDRTEEALKQVQKMILETLDHFNQASHKGNQITDFQYYKDANLFVVIGNRQAVDIARKIIKVLPGMATIDDSVASHYGIGPGTPGANLAGDQQAMDAFRRRYGLSPETAGPGMMPKDGVAPPPGQPGSKK